MRYHPAALLRLHPYRIHLLLFAIGLAVYGAVAGDHLLQQSSDPHFVFQADAWLHGHLAIDPPPRKGDDWAKVETVLLHDGSTADGRRLQSRPVFLTLRGEEIPLGRVARTDHITYFVSFPPFPALLMLPQTAISGRRANDVIPTVLIAALVLPLCFATLRRLAAAGMSRRTIAEDLWLVACLAFGTVFFFSAVQGRVWFTAHVVGVALALGYAWASIEARRPLIAGLCLGLATMTRTPMAFMFPLFLLEAWRMAAPAPRGSAAAGTSDGNTAGGDKAGGNPAGANPAGAAPVGLAGLLAEARPRLRPFLRRAALFAAPILVIAVIAIAYNLARFGAPTEFGHSYLAVRQQAQIEAHGLFSYSYLARNLAVAFTLLPDLVGHAPYVSISGHGLALWLTTPALLLLLWPAVRNPLHRALWITVACVAVPTFFYQNSGWVQFGYRFSLDYTPFLILLLAVGGRPLGRGARALIAAGIAINLFGAITFARYPEVYRSDNATYQTVVKH